MLTNQHHTENIFSYGCLIQLSISQWGASRKLPKNVIERMANGKSNWLKGSKNLVEPESLKAIKKIANSARTYLNTISLPFPIKGLLFTPKDLISTIDAKLQGIKEDFLREVENFSYEYPTLRNDAIFHLGEYANQLDYPIDIKSRFGFEWRFITLDTPANGNLGILSPELYEREKQKFISTMDEAKDMAVNALHQEFLSLISHMIERLSPEVDGTQKTFRDSLIDNFNQFFETFKQRNIFQNEDLAELVNRAQNILHNTTPDNLRNNMGLCDRITNDMQQVKNALSEAIINLPKRKITL